MARRGEDVRAELDETIAEGDRPDVSGEPIGRFDTVLAPPDEVTVGESTRQAVSSVFDTLAAIVEQGAAGGGRLVSPEELAARFPTFDLDGQPGGGGAEGMLGRAAPETSGGTSGGLAWGDFENGRIPEDALVPISGGGRLEPAAAAAWERMREAAAEEGVTLTPSSENDTYRPLTVQQTLAGQKPRLAAEPGTSNHGWGRAVDLSPEGREWVQRNGERFGWVWPDWARPDRKNEPWHFEFRPSDTVDSEAIDDFDFSRLGGAT